METVIVEVEKYKSLDGRIYNQKEDAEKADARWKDEHEFDLEKELAYYRKVAERKKITGSESSLATLIILHGKHDDVYAIGKSREGVLKAYFEIFSRQYADGFYSYGGEKDRVISEYIYNNNDYLAAIGFLQDHRAGEYENFTVTYVDIRD